MDMQVKVGEYFQFSATGLDRPVAFAVVVLIAFVVLVIYGTVRTARRPVYLPTSRRARGPLDSRKPLHLSSGWGAKWGSSPSPSPRSLYQSGA